MISKQLSETLGFAVREAKKRRHEYVSIEHLLFAILYDSDGAEIIESCGGSIDNLKTTLEEFFSERMESIPEGNEYVLQQTVGFQRVIQRAVNHVRSAEKQEVAVSDILASIFLEKDSHSEHFLNAEGTTFPIHHSVRSRRNRLKPPGIPRKRKPILSNFSPLILSNRLPRESLIP